jgi:hypothetical protein
MVGARPSDGVSPFRLFGRYRITKSLDLKILRRRFSTVAYDLKLDLLAFIERGQTRPLHSRNVHKHILPAALRLDESIAFGRIKPLHSPGRHQSSPRGKRGRPPNLHIPMAAAIKFVNHQWIGHPDTVKFARPTVASQSMLRHRIGKAASLSSMKSPSGDSFHRLLGSQTTGRTLSSSI